MDQTAQAAPKPCTLTKAQAELLESARSLVTYLELVASGAIPGPVDVNHRAMALTKDALRLVRLQGGSFVAAVADAGEPSDEAWRMAGIAFTLMD